MFESSPTIHEELGRMRQADRLSEAHERHTAHLAVDSAAPAGLRTRTEATLRRLHDAVAERAHVSSQRRRPTTPATHH